MRPVVVCLVAILLSGCSVTPDLVSSNTSFQPEAGAIPHAAPTSVLVIGEQGPYHADGLIEIFRAPFDGTPVRLHHYDPKGVAIAPNGDLIVFDEFDGLWVYDPPYTRKPRRISRELLSDGQLLFDSKDRLFAVSSGGGALVFDPPYTSGPVININVPPDTYEMAFDSHYNVFVSSGEDDIYECTASTQYSECKVILRSDAGVALNEKDDLFTERPNGPPGTLRRFPPPYREASAKREIGFRPFAIAATSEGMLLAAGYDERNTIHLAIFPSGMEGKMFELPIEQYFDPLAAFTVLRNRGDLFVSGESHSRPCVDVYPYPYNKGPVRCVKVKYPIESIYAR